MTEAELIPKLFKTEHRKIISVLCKLFGLVHIEVAEDITNDTFLLAAETWRIKGIPENPTAWLYIVAKNKTKDYIKRNSLFAEKIAPEFESSQPHFTEIELDLSSQNINDSQLRMLFAICNPIIPVEAQIGLALRILCGFGIEEIAEAFLSNKETINKRLFRAKEKLRLENVKLELPRETDIKARLDAVLSVIYLLFNEGYYSSTQNTVLRKEFCFEAMQLNYFLLENQQTNTPLTNALMSLMCFHASRFEARTNSFGEYILYEEQDRNLWDDELILKGNTYLILSAKGQEISKYHFEASIAYWHSAKTETANKWENILQLYNKLLLLEYSPITALNRTYALSKTKGKQAAIVEAEKLNLPENRLYYSLLGNLYTTIDNPTAIQLYEKAYLLAKTESDKRIIEKQIHKIRQGLW
jgi:RNA polymerase sigma factor (sigma-70 family)